MNFREIIIGDSMDVMYEKGHKSFLTDAVDQDSSVSWHTEVMYYSPKVPNIEACLKIRDCYKLVNLDFFSSDDKGAEQSIDKLNNLIFSLSLFMSSLKQARQYQQEAQLWLRQ